MPSLDTRKVLDMEVLSKYCQVYAAHRDMDETSDEFLDWWEEHQASCETNYKGSSPAVESHGALNIWKRYVELYMFRYTP